MPKLTRKNLMVDDEEVKELARLRGMSESAAVREAIRFALAGAVAEDVFRKLQARGGVDDVFGTLPPEHDDALDDEYDADAYEDDEESGRRSVATSASRG